MSREEWKFFNGGPYPTGSKESMRWSELLGKSIVHTLKERVRDGTLRDASELDERVRRASPANTVDHSTSESSRAQWSLEVGAISGPGSLAQAAAFATQLHATQLRKGTSIPYVAHLFAVCSLVLEYGGSEEEAIAALLHDAVEDQGGERTLQAIHGRFGTRVAGLVHGCTDAFTRPKPPWRKRKEAHLEHLKHTTDQGLLLIVAADKLHNARSILADVRLQGLSVFERFDPDAGIRGTLWYYASLAEILGASGPGPIAAELRRVVAELESLTRELSGSAGVPRPAASSTASRRGPRRPPLP